MHYDECDLSYCAACEDYLYLDEVHHEARFARPEGGWCRLAFCTDMCMDNYIEEYPELELIEEFPGV